MERTFAMVKPDGVQRGLVGEITGSLVGLRSCSQELIIPTSLPDTMNFIGNPFTGLVGTSRGQWCDGTRGKVRSAWSER